MRVAKRPIFEFFFCLPCSAWPTESSYQWGYWQKMSKKKIIQRLYVGKTAKSGPSWNFSYTAQEVPEGVDSRLGQGQRRVVRFCVRKQSPTCHFSCTKPQFEPHIPFSVLEVQVLKSKSKVPDTQFRQIRTFIDKQPAPSIYTEKLPEIRNQVKTSWRKNVRNFGFWL